jgi:hypothetical protein
MNAWLKPDPQAIRESLRLLGVGQGHVTELRVLNARESANSPYPFTFGGYFDDVEALIKAALSIRYASGWYTLLNPCHPDVLGRFCNRAVKLGKGESTQDSEIVRRRWLPIDTDPVRLSRISSTEEEHQLALDRAREVASHLRSQGWSDPIIADSGNGGHLLYRIDLPIDDGGLVERCLKALDQRFSDDRVKVDTSVDNPARIWKLYGTPACKGDSTPNRPHRMARVIEVPDGW